MDPFVADLKQKIITALSLEGRRAADIPDDAPLFGTGLGLDSIDALELVAMLESEYGIVIQERSVADQAFRSVRALGDFILQQRRTCAGDSPS